VKHEGLSCEQNSNTRLREGRIGQEKEEKDKQLEKAARNT